MEFKNGFQIIKKVHFEIAYRNIIYITHVVVFSAALEETRIYMQMISIHSVSAPKTLQGLKTVQFVTENSHITKYTPVSVIS